MPNGTIKFFNAAKKFGFVTPDEGEKDVFVPVASVLAAGISTLTAGQRVSFEAVPDGKGPKAVNLVLIETPPPPHATKAPPPVLREQRRPQFTFYHDSGCDRSRKVLAELREAGVEMREIDYVVTPLGREDLKRLSMLLQDGSGSLVRRYDPLFHDLRLDDRFISQNEFWDGIVENPSLINGPVIASANRAFLCGSGNAVKQFLATVFPGRVHASEERKAVAEFATPRAAKAGAVKSTAADEEASQSETVSAESDGPKTATAGKKTKAAPKTKAKVKAEPAARKAAKTSVRKTAQKPRSTREK